MIDAFFLQDSDPAFDPIDGEDENGREFVAARAAADGRYLLYEMADGYLAIPAGTETVSAVTVDKLMARLGVPYDVDEPSAPDRYKEIGVTHVSE